MNLTFPVAAFAEAAKAIRQIPHSGIKLDIFEHARLVAADGAMCLTMSDMDMEAHVSIPCEADAPEIAAAIPRPVLDFFVMRAEAFGEGRLEFDAGMRNVVARHGRARLSLPILPADQFVVMDDVTADWTIRLRAHEFCQALARCEKAVSENESQPMLLGPFLHLLDGVLRMIGADGHRFHIVDLDGVSPEGALPARSGSTLPGIILPPRAVREIQRIWNGDEAAMTVCGTATRTIVATQRIRFVTKLIDATYYDYPKLIPRRGEGSIHLPVEALARALDALVVVPKTDTKGKAVRTRAVRITIQDGAIDLFTRGDAGDAGDTVDAEVTGVEPGLQIMVAVSYLREILDASRSKTVTIYPPVEIGLPFHIRGDRDDGLFLLAQRRGF